jgi:hypothetical protein
MAKKNEQTIAPDKGEIVLYQSPDGKAALNVRLDRETVWLNQRQMAELFDKDTDTIGLHIRNIYKEGELARKGTTEESSVVQNEGGRQVRRKVGVFNLDVIISVGYRVKSKRGTQFRIWATNVLREHLVRGFTLNAGFRCLVPYNCRKALCKRNSGFEEKIRGQSGRFCKLPQCYRRIGEPMGTGREAASRAISQALGACA